MYLRLAHSLITIPAATATGNEWFTPYIGIPTTSCARATNSGESPALSLPKTSTTPRGKPSTSYRLLRAWSFSTAHTGLPAAHAKKASSSASLTTV